MIDMLRYVRVSLLIPISWYVSRVADVIPRRVSKDYFTMPLHICGEFDVRQQKLSLIG